MLYYLFVNLIETRYIVHVFYFLNTAWLRSHTILRIGCVFYFDDCMNQFLQKENENQAVIPGIQEIVRGTRHGYVFCRKPKAECAVYSLACAAKDLFRYSCRAKLEREQKLEFCLLEVSPCTFDSFPNPRIVT